VSYEEGRNGGLPQGNSKSVNLKANRRFCLPSYEPKQYVIPNESTILIYKYLNAKRWMSEGSPAVIPISFLVIFLSD